MPPLCFLAISMRLPHYHGKKPAGGQENIFELRRIDISLFIPINNTLFFSGLARGLPFLLRRDVGRGHRSGFDQDSRR